MNEPTITFERSMSAHELLGMLKDPAQSALLKSMGWDLEKMRNECEKAIFEKADIMNCTCSKRLLPCPVHPDRHLPFAPEPCVKMFVINLHEAWPAESVDRKDIRYYTTVVEDAIRVFKSSDHNGRNSAILEAANFLTLTTR